MAAQPTTTPATTSPVMAAATPDTSIHQVMLVPNPTVHSDPVWMTLPFWISVLSVSVAIISFWNSRAQRKATELATYEKMRLDLFSKRFATYTAVFDLLQWYLGSHSNTLSHEGIMKFKAATNDAVFLFNDDLKGRDGKVGYLDELLTKAIAYHIHSKKVDHVGIANMKPDDMLEDQKLVEWLSEQYTNSIVKFDPYLNFRSLPVAPVQNRKTRQNGI